MVSYTTYSDNNWDISTPNFNDLTKTISDTLAQYNQNLTPTTSFVMTSKYELIRQVTDTVSSPTTYNYPFMNGTEIVLNKLELNQQ